jgi:hypothetical protein
MDSSNQRGGYSEARPERLETITTTQFDELERQFNEGDQSAWNELAKSYGWDEAEIKEVWDWFGTKPTGGHPQADMGGGSTRGM